MKKFNLLIFFTLMSLSINSYAQFSLQFKKFDINNLSTYVYNHGILDQNLQISNMPGLEWPKNSGKFALFTSGLTVGAMVNNELRMGACAFNSEYLPGYINSSGEPVTNASFKVYKVSKNDNASNNPDYANWGLMVPYGAPYNDINNNGIYDAAVDKPGVPGADQTLFVCVTDGFPEAHQYSLFGGGTAPLKAQVGVTVWGYDAPLLENAYFTRWVVTNKSSSNWQGTYFSVVKDIDIGSALDDYIGCDTNLNLVYGYNGDNMDGDGMQYTYGANPPAVGIVLLSSPKGLTSAVSFTNLSEHPPLCEFDPVQDAPGAYNMMKGYKKDGTPWLVATTGPNYKKTKYIYTGNPVTGAGWTEHDGYVNNCGDSLTGTVVSPNRPGDRRIVLNSGADNLTVAPGESKTMIISNIITRGADNVSSVSQLSVMSDDIREKFQTGQLGVVGVTPISVVTPGSYRLEQNYPNPFNPSTTIRFDIPENAHAKLTIYDALGKEVSVLVDGSFGAGTYEADFNANSLSSGIYYYTLKTESFIETRKMLLVK